MSRELWYTIRIMQHSSYCFSHHNFLIELIAGIGGAFLVGVPGVILGSFFGSVYSDSLVWGKLAGEQAGGMLGLVVGLAVGGWLLVYLMGQIIHDHRSGIVSFIATILGLFMAFFMYDSSFPALLAFVILMLPVIGATLGYNLPVERLRRSTSPSLSESSFVLPPVSLAKSETMVKKRTRRVAKRKVMTT